MVVNGKTVDLNQKQTLYDYLVSEDYNLATIAVERNGEIVPKATYQAVLLQEEDKLEIVRFVGGG